MAKLKSEYLLSIILMFIVVFQIPSGLTQKADVVCTSSRDHELCDQVQRGSSEVTCQLVQDSIECAHRILNGTASVGVFTAESTTHLASLGWSEFVIIRELRHRDRIQSTHDFESVVLVKSSFTGGIDNLKGLKFCHPGLFYDRTQKWSERFLKYFERSITTPDCKIDGDSPAEIEASALSRFFSETCRPGSWSNDPQEDQRLKSKYPNLCSLCGGTSDCSHPISGSVAPSDHHQLALECLRLRGDVAYVSSEDALRFMAVPENQQNYQYLCPNGTLRSNETCPWLKQPWGVIITNRDKSMDMNAKLTNWVNSLGYPWKAALTEIIAPDNHIPLTTTIQQPRDYISAITSMPIPIDLCSTSSRWCTTSPEEYAKCDVLRHAGIATGILPVIECTNTATNNVACLNDINSTRADFMGIDSNFGYLARHPYNLTNALYAETENRKYSSVVVVVKESSNYTRFENLRNSRGCLPEFGGIAAISFINTGKNRGFLVNDDCDFSKLLSEFFSKSCLPGASDPLHDPLKRNPESLCSLCQTNMLPMSSAMSDDVIIENGIIDGSALDYDTKKDEGVDDTGVPASDDAAPVPSGDDAGNDNADGDVVGDDGMGFIPSTQSNLKASCKADSSNRYYGNRGALLCLAEVGDVAIVELQNLEEHASKLGFSPNQFRIICRNGTLANYTGFQVDPACALTTIVDGEVVVRRHDKKTDGIRNALLSLDKYLQRDPKVRMYNEFAGQQNLLFKDSTLGLISPHDKANLAESVHNYIELFKDVDTCVAASDRGAGSSVTANIVNIFLLTVASVCFFFF